jgi:hypothetical protein
MTARSGLVWMVTAAALAATTGLAFAAWLDKGPAIFMSLVEAGMALCF